MLLSKAGVGGAELRSVGVSVLRFVHTHLVGGWREPG
jgi:hypothetical protein